MKKEIVILTAIVLAMSCKKNLTESKNEIEQKRRPTVAVVQDTPTIDFVTPHNGDTVGEFVKVIPIVSSLNPIESVTLMESRIVNGVYFGCLDQRSTSYPCEFIWNSNYICLQTVSHGESITLRLAVKDINGALNYKDITVVKR